MKISEVTIDVVKKYLRIDINEDDELLEAILEAAKQYAASYTGLSKEELEEYADIPLAVLALCSDMYEVRQFTVNSTSLNPTAAQILGSHCRNLI